jgi:hypothetical protein
VSRSCPEEVEGVLRVRAGKNRYFVRWSDFVIFLIVAIM